MTTESSPPVIACFAGIDVAKDALDLARSDRAKVQRFDNTPAGIAALLKELAATPPTCIVVEATGGLETPLVQALLEDGLPVARVNPGNVRHFAMGLGILAKTDAIDAQVLCRFAQLAAPRLTEKRAAHLLELEALVTVRRQLIKTRTEQTNRKLTVTSKPAKNALNGMNIQISCGRQNIWGVEMDVTATAVVSNVSEAEVNQWGKDKTIFLSGIATGTPIGMFNKKFARPALHIVVQSGKANAK